MTIHRARPDVAWHDLIAMTPRQQAIEWTISLPWLAGSLYAYHRGWIAVGLACSFYFFLTALRQAHGAQHYTLARKKRGQDLLLVALSFLMLSSLHALQATHWHHHRHSMEPDDVESATAHLPWWLAVLSGPRFIVSLHREGFALARPDKRVWLVTEVLAIAAWIPILAFVPAAALRWHVCAMLVGECLTGFFAVWTVHHDCDGAPGARTQRGRVVNWLSFGMFYHEEHHRYPAVATPNLPRLAARLDALESRRLQQVVGPVRRSEP